VSENINSFASPLGISDLNSASIFFSICCCGMTVGAGVT